MIINHFLRYNIKEGAGCIIDKPADPITDFDEWEGVGFLMLPADDSDSFLTRPADCIDSFLTGSDLIFSKVYNTCLDDEAEIE